MRTESHRPSYRAKCFAFRPMANRAGALRARAQWVLLEGFRLRPLVKSARLSRAFVGLADSDTS